MSSTTVACPRCHAALRANKPVHADRALRCPRCGHAFHTTPPSVTANPPPLPPSPLNFPEPSHRGTPVWVPLLAAAFLAVLLVGGGLAVGLYLTLPTLTPTPPATPPVVEAKGK